MEIGSKGELMPRSKIRWEPFNLHSQYYMVFAGNINLLTRPSLPDKSLQIYRYAPIDFIFYLKERERNESLGCEKCLMYCQRERETPGGLLFKFLRDTGH